MQYTQMKTFSKDNQQFRMDGASSKEHMSVQGPQFLYAFILFFGPV